MYHQLLDILFKIPSLVEEFERSKSSNQAECHRQVSSLLFKALNIEEELMQWYRKLDTDEVNEPLFLIQPTPVSNGINATNGRITFRNESIIPLVLLYWLGMVIIYTTVTAALQTSDAMDLNSFQMQESTLLDSSLSHANRSQDSLARNFDLPLAHCENQQSVLTCATLRHSHYAQRISDSMLDCAHKSFGTAIVATLTSYVMRQFCSKPSEDLAYLLEAFSRRGLKFSYV
jgi:hypothetical protein